MAASLAARMSLAAAALCAAGVIDAARSMLLFATRRRACPVKVQAKTAPVEPNWDYVTHDRCAGPLA